MKRVSIFSLAVASFPLLVASAPMAKADDPCQGLPPWQLFVDGQAEEEFFAQNSIDDIIDGLDLGLDNRFELANILIRLDSNPLQVFKRLPVGLQGIGGFITALTLQKYLDEAGEARQGNAKPIAEKVLSGKIRDYILETNPDDPTRGTGHLSVDMCTKNITTGQRQFFHWDIEVRHDQFAITEESPPDTSRPLDHKLSANGTSIEVHHVYFRDLTNPRLVRLDRSSGHHYYDSTPTSCIDLFTEGEPPATFGELMERDFCLGRCAHPPIVNTGGG